MNTDLPPEPIPIYQEADLPSSFARDVVLAAFAADSHSLGPHWIYDTDKISSLYPKGIDELDTPRSEYHPQKTKGDFTHYGDQMFVQLEVISENQAWNKDQWMEQWLAFWQSEPVSYLDGATRDVLDAWESEGTCLPSHSHDLAGASRMAPVLSLYAERPVDEAVAAVREQTASTHENAAVMDAAEFFARAIYAVRAGSDYTEAFKHAAAEGDYQSEIVAMYEEAISAEEETDYAVSLHFGQSCDVRKAFPLTIWFALTYENSPVEMLEANALVGGDSSARATLLAMLIAAKGQFPELPTEWTSDQTKALRIRELLVPLLETPPLSKTSH